MVMVRNKYEAASVTLGEIAERSVCRHKCTKME